MNKYRKSKHAAEKFAAKTKAKAQKQLKKDIGRNRSRAKWVGIWYLLGIIAMAATLVLSVVMTEGRLDAIIGGFSGMENNMNEFIVSIVYALMALVAVVNVFKALGKLGWLHKKKATMEYGFNRNAYAMNDLSGLFTGTATFVFVNYLLIQVLSATTSNIFDILMGDMMILICFAVAVVIALFADAWGGKVKYYDIDEGHINVEQHLVGRFAGFIRKLFRIVAVLGLAFALDYKALHTSAAAFYNKGAFNFSVLTGDMELLLIAVVGICICIMAKRAFRATDYSLDGVGGDKGFAFFAFVTLALGVGLGVITGTWVGEAAGTEIADYAAAYRNIIIIAVSALAFIFELILRRCFKFSEEVEAEKQAKKDKKAAKKAAKKQAKKDKKANKKAEKKQIKEDKKQGTRYSKEDDKADVPSNWNDGEFTFDTLMRMGNITIVTNQPSKK